jgi:hypothetical protein
MQSFSVLMRVECIVATGFYRINLYVFGKTEDSELDGSNMILATS